VGADFDAELLRAVTNSETMLVLIGPEWLTLSDAEGGRRIDDSQDYVRREIALAVELDKRILTLRVNGAPPLPTELYSNQVPSDVFRIAYVESFVVRDDEHFDEDMRAVTKHMRTEAFNQSKEDGKRLGRRILGFGFLGLLVFGLTWQFFSFPAVSSWATTDQSRFFVSNVRGTFGFFSALCMPLFYDGAWIEAFSAGKWRWMVSTIVLTLAVCAGYLTVFSHAYVIPARFQIASVLAAWTAIVGLFGDLILVLGSFPFRLSGRAQATKTP
jgi:hypothetical protein